MNNNNKTATETPNRSSLKRPYPNDQDDPCVSDISIKNLAIIKPVQSPETTSGVPIVNKSPINLVYEKFPNVVFTCESVDTENCNLRFKVVCCIEDQNFEGFGSSKKSAKLGASKSALAALGISLPVNKPAPQEISSLEQPTLPSLLPLPTPPPPAQISSNLHQTLADRIARIVIEKFNELLQADPVHIRRKVLAGIVMTSGTNYEHMEVIAVSSGTKCVSGERLSTCGLAVNDCHAEVVARRCFQEFLYDCLKDIAESSDGRGQRSNPLEPAPDGGYQVRGSYRFHLYISTAPCGDARIFSPHEETCRPPDRHPNRQARGQLRTKIESGEGTIPVKSSDGIQTWDGVLQGERLLTMSCSDKVCRWNVLGLQGALLSIFLRPIYLESIVLGSLLHPHHLYRAVCGRLVGTLKGLPPPFRLNRPMLIQCSSSEQRQAMRAPSFSVNWTKGHEAAEIVNAMTGKTDSGLSSRICKHNMFKMWTRLASRLSPAPQPNWGSYNNINCVPIAPKHINFDIHGIQYDIAKSKALLYQTSKLALYNAFLKANLGKWLKKPIEQDQFETFDTGDVFPATCL
ncbi:adenosine deaminase acting on RNA isoform X2 [Arctopsyche grandis]|uniref:adenosine deaminase acting on RNA isoform X2 n=1 Tax=Arctopsyche grandis TaxID=121162 RepID=UPI00406D6B9A